MMGRPTVMTEEAQEAVLAVIADGGTLSDAAKAAGVGRTAILARCKSDDAFARRYAVARQWQADAIHDAMVEIERGLLAGTIEPAAARTALYSQQWRAARLAPKVYGDRVSMEHSGPDGGAMQITRIERVIVSPPEHPDARKPAE